MEGGAIKTPCRFDRGRRQCFFHRSQHTRSFGKQHSHPLHVCLSPLVDVGRLKYVYGRRTSYILFLVLVVVSNLLSGGRKATFCFISLFFCGLIRPNDLKLSPPYIPPWLHLVTTPPPTTDTVFRLVGACLLIVWWPPTATQ